MPFPTRVLCATDLSEPADEAVRQAHAWAEGAGAALGVCHVVRNPLRVSPLFPQLNAAMALEAAALVPKAAEELERRAVALTGRRPGSFEVLVDEGEAFPIVLATAERWRADLLAVASQGASGVPRILLGSVGERLVRYAHCAVLVARPIPAAGRILAATDLSAASLPAVAAAAEVAARTGASLAVLHALDAGLSFAAFAAASPGGSVLPSWEEPRRRARALAEASLAEALDGLPVKAEALLEEGPAAAAILRAAERLRAELVVLGTHGRTGLERLALGSVAETVVRAAPCPAVGVRRAAGA